MVKAILFDLDGTLRDTQEIIYTAIEHGFAMHGHRFDRAEMEPFIHHHREVYRGLVGDEGLEDFDRDYQAKVDEMIMSAVLFDGAADLLQRLHEAGYRMALVSSARQGGEYLQEKQLRDYFEVIVGAQDVTHLKPDPEPILVALERLDLSPDEVVMIGDLSADMESARSAHVPQRIGITHGFSTKQQLVDAGATATVDSLDAIPHLLK